MNPEGAAGMRVLVLSEVQGLQKHAAACRVAGFYRASPWRNTARAALAASNKVLSLNRLRRFQGGGLWQP